jgi:hypothetical protein
MKGFQCQPQALLDGPLNVLATDESDTELDQTFEEGESPFAWEMRVLLVSVFWMLPGVLFGILVRLCVLDGGPVGLWLAGGGLLGAIAGGILEAGYLTG